MKVLNIHDYHEDKNNIAYKALQACEFDIINPQFDYDETDVFPLFDLICAEFNKNFCDVIVGTGIGAFFAMLLSAKEAVPCVLVNPAVVPGMLLLKHGYNRYVGVRRLQRLEYRYMHNFNLCGTSTIIDKQTFQMSESMLQYTKELLHNPRYYGIDPTSDLTMVDLFKNHKKEWFYDTCEIDLTQ